MKASDKLLGFTREVPVSEHLGFSSHVTENIVSTHNAEYMSVWRLTGRSHVGASLADAKRWLRELNNTLKGIGTPHVAIWTHIVRREVDSFLDGDFDNFFCRKLDDEYRKRFSDQRLMVNELYVSVVYRPVPEKLRGMLAKAENASMADKRDMQESCIESLEEVNRTLSAALRKRYGGQLLGFREEDGKLFSEVGEFLGYLVNGEYHKIPLTNARLGVVIPINRLFFSSHDGVGEIRGIQDRKYFGMLELTEYPEATEPGHLNTLLENDFEFVLTQSFTCLSRSAAKGFLQRHVRYLEDSRDVAVSQIEQIYEALDGLQSGEFIMGQHHATLNIFGRGLKSVRDRMGRAVSALQDVGIFFKPVDRALQAGFWAQFPTNWSYIPRPTPITSQNFLSFSSFHNFMEGKPSGNPWGPAVSMLKTASGSPLFFNFHASRPDLDVTNDKMLGHTVMVGKSGSGKTVAMTFLLAQAQRFKPTVVCFDKDRGMEVAIRAMGGHYLPLKTGLPTGFNPLGLEMTPRHEDFCRTWLRGLIEASGEPMSHQDENELASALESLRELPRADRNLTMLSQFLPAPRATSATARPTVHDRLKAWCQGGDYGWVFDNPQDRLDLGSHRLYGFDITEFLDHPAIRGPLMTYLTYRTEGMVGEGESTPFIYLIDEFWKPLQDEYFQNLVRDQFKTGRKKDVVMFMATQEPDDVLSLPIAKTVIQQSATLILMPNPSATREDYIDGLKLTESEYELVRNLGEESRQFVVKQGGSCAVAELNLAGMGEALTVLSGNPELGDISERVVQEVGDNPSEWLPVYWQRVLSVGNQEVA